jgi:hypothetical protein
LLGMSKPSERANEHSLSRQKRKRAFRSLS